MKLFQGSWLCVPAEEVKPGAFIEFGSKSDGSLTGTCGVVQYSFKEGKSDLRISWDNPFFEKSCFNKYAPAGFAVETREMVDKNSALLFYDIVESAEVEEKQEKEEDSQQFIQNLKFKLISHNSHLFPPSRSLITDPMRRAKLLCECLLANDGKENETTRSKKISV